MYWEALKRSCAVAMPGFHLFGLAYPPGGLSYSKLNANQLQNMGTRSMQDSPHLASSIIWGILLKPVRTMHAMLNNNSVSSPVILSSLFTFTFLHFYFFFFFSLDPSLTTHVSHFALIFVDNLRLSRQREVNASSTLAATGCFWNRCKIVGLVTYC